MNGSSNQFAETWKLAVLGNKDARNKVVETIMRPQRSNQPNDNKPC